MLRYNELFRLANNLAEKDVEFNIKLNKNITKEDEQLIFVKRFNYYLDILKKDELFIDDSSEERTLIED